MGALGVVTDQARGEPEGDGRPHLVVLGDVRLQAEGGHLPRPAVVVVEPLEGRGDVAYGSSS